MCVVHLFSTKKLILLLDLKLAEAITYSTWLSSLLPLIHFTQVPPRNKHIGDDQTITMTEIDSLNGFDLGNSSDLVRRDVQRGTLWVNGETSFRASWLSSWQWSQMQGFHLICRLCWELGAHSNQNGFLQVLCHNSPWGPFCWKDLTSWSELKLCLFHWGVISAEVQPQGALAYEMFF